MSLWDEVGALVDQRIGEALERAESAESQLQAALDELATAHGDLAGASSRIDQLEADVASLTAELVKARARIVELEKPVVTDPAVLPFWGAPVFRDEFTGGKIDPAKWNVRNNDSLSYDWGYIQASNATIEDDKLHLRITRRPAPVTSGGRARHWNTAYLDSIGKFTQQHGRWEMRAKLPTLAGVSQGVWPAFWLRNDDVGEIDIMESWGDKPKNRTRSASLTETSTATIHASTNGGKSYGVTYEPRAKTAAKSADGFHTWAVEYTPTDLKFYFDGVLTEHVTRTGDQHAMATTTGKGDFAWVWGPTFMSPWNIRLNIQMGDPYWSSDTGAGVLDAKMPADFVVDYVRVYALPS